MRLHYTVTEADYLEFNVYHVRHSPGYKRTLLSLALLAPALIIAFTAMAMTFFTIPLLVWGVVAAAVCLYWVATMERRLDNLVKRHVRKLTAKINEFTGDYTLELLEDGLVYIGHGQLNKLAYSRISRVAEDRGGLYLLLGAVSAIIIPASAFASSEEKDGFLAQLAAKMPGPGHSEVA